MFHKKDKETIDLSIFEQAIQEGKIDDAVLIGSNLLNQHPKNITIYSRLFNLLCDLALKSDDLLIKEGYYGLANDACSSFTLSMDLNSDNINLIKRCRERLKEVQENRIKKQIEVDNTDIQRIIEMNSQVMDIIKRDSICIDNCNSLEELEEVSKEIVKTDHKLNQAYMADFQDEYDDIMKKISEKITEKTHSINLQSNQKINIEAVEAYKKLLKSFQTKEKDCKNNIALLYPSIDDILKYEKYSRYPLHARQSR